MEKIERVDYAGEGLAEQDVPAAPWPLIEAWVDQARIRAREQGDVPEPDSLNVATVDEQGRPSVRVVLMRHLDASGPGFYTNLDSAKARDLRANPNIAATLTWPSMFRAIRFSGVAREMDRDHVREYFRSRPWGSRAGAWASHQSQPLADRAEFEQRVAHFEAEFPDRGNPDDVPLPDFWGGFVVECREIEFWAGRRSRLHDRVVFTRSGDGDLSDSGAWSISRRQP